MDEDAGRFRELSGPSAVAWKVLLTSIPVIGMVYIMGLHTYLGMMIYEQQYVGLLISLVLAAAFIGMPGGERSPRRHVPWYDWLLAAASLPVGLYLAFWYPKIVMSLGIASPERVLLGILAVILCCEAVRRIDGWALVITLGIFLVYAFVAPYLPGILQGSHTSFSNLFNYLYLDPNSMLDQVTLAGDLALPFIVFGQVLLLFGGADLINNVALGAFGRLRGGPAKAAIVGSSLVGMVTGGPVTNVMLVGSVTIPMMIKTGFKPVVAGAVEAVASSGGQLMPPVMGAAAFLIADYIGVPYAQVALAALIPALLYYFCLFSQVDLLAAKNGNVMLTRADLPPFLRSMRQGWVLVPALATLIWTMFILKYQPSTSGVLSAGVALPFLLIRPDARERFWPRLLETFAGSGRMLVDLCILFAVSGFLVGVTGVTGLGFNLTMGLKALGGDNLGILLVVCAIISFFLGTALPTVPAYALPAVLLAPAMVQLGVPALAAHLFIFYYALVSNFTPPVAPACFAAATYAKANQTAIGYEAMRLGILSYIVPFLFVYSPALLLQGDWATIVVSIVTAVIGTWMLAIALVGYYYRPVSVFRRVMLAISALLLLSPVSLHPSLSWVLNGAGLLLAVGFVAVERRARKSSPAAQPDKEPKKAEGTV